MRWVILALLLSAPLKAQDLKDFPVVRSVSSVTLVGFLLLFDLAPVNPPPSFRVWWSEMEECTGYQGNYDAMKWFLASQIAHPGKGESYWGVHFSDLGTIAVLRGLSDERLENTVKHEIIHHLILDPEHRELAFTNCLPVILP